MFKQKLRICELFAGIGGFRLGIEQALGTENTDFVYVSEWDKYAAQTYEKNFSWKPDTRDIKLVSTTEIPDHDLLCGGFPCQSFSIAGKRGGFNDTRGTMFFEVARIVKDKRPTYLLLENVKGLLSHDNGRTFETIMRTLNELGYECQWQVLNSKNFGVAQNRERVFIIGNLRGKSRPKIFPITGDDTESIKQRQEVCATLKSRYPGDWNGNYIARQPLKFLQRNQKNITGDYVYTIDSANTGGLNVNGSIRRLTPTECLRLQGFPDTWFDVEGLSDTQKYKQVGNAVTVPVVMAIMVRMEN